VSALAPVAVAQTRAELAEEQDKLQKLTAALTALD